MTDKKEKEQPPTTIQFRRDDGPSSRTDRALEYEFSRTSIQQRLKASEEFRAKAGKILGDRFIKRPEVESLIETFFTDLRSSYGAGIAEQDPLRLANLNASEYFYIEFTTSRIDCTIYNVTSHDIPAWDYDDHVNKIFKPGDVMRYGEDNPWVIEMGMRVIRLLHHNPSRAISALEGRPQITVFKEELVEPTPSWDRDKDKNANQPPRTPTPS